VCAGFMVLESVCQMGQYNVCTIPRVFIIRTIKRTVCTSGRPEEGEIPRDKQLVRFACSSSGITGSHTIDREEPCQRLHGLIRCTQTDLLRS
jgi:hypothetical protein